MEGRRVKDSASTLSEFALPNDANPLGNLLGGRIMHLVDLAGATAAIRHARSQVVTVSVDTMTFLRPIHIGELITLKASVNRVFRTSLEVGVRVIAENLETGEVRHTNSSFVTFVALDAEGKPHEVAPVIPETDTEHRRWREAGERREQRLLARGQAIERDRR